MDKRISERIDSIIENKDFLSELVSAKSKSDLYGLLSESGLDCSADELDKYFSHCYKKIIELVKNEAPYSDNAMSLIRIYGDICKDADELKKFGEKRSISEVLDYFNSLSKRVYSLEDVANFYRFQFMRLCQKFLLSSVIFSLNRPSNNGKSRSKSLSDDALEVSGGVGNRAGKLLGSIFGTLSVLSPFGAYGGNRVSAAAAPAATSDIFAAPDAASSSSFYEEEKDYMDRNEEFDDSDEGEDAAQEAQNSGTWNAVWGIAVGAIASKMGGWLGLDFLPKNMEGWAKLPEQFKAMGKMYETFMRGLVGDPTNVKKKIENMVLGTNDYLFDALSGAVKGQNEAMQSIVGNILGPYLEDVTCAAQKRQSEGGSFFNMGNDPIDPEQVRTYLGAIYGDRGVGKTRMVNTIRYGILRDAVPSATLSLGSFGASGQSFIDWISSQSEYIDMMGKMRYMRNFALFFDEFDKIPEGKRKEVFEVIREWSDKTQLKIKEKSGTSGSGSTETCIQGESGLILLLSNAAGPNENDAAMWRERGLTSDPSIKSRLTDITFKNIDDTTMDLVMNTLIMNCQKRWYTYYGIDVEFDDTFTYNAIQWLRYLGYEVQDGAREINNRLVTMLKTEFASKLDSVKHKIERLVSDGVDESNIKVEFRWVNRDEYYKKYKKESGGWFGKNGKESSVTPELRVVVNDDKSSDGSPTRFFDRATGSLVKAPMELSSQNWKALMSSLRKWKSWAKQYTVDGSVKKYKILEVFNILRFTLNECRSIGKNKHKSSVELNRVLNNWSRFARLNVQEEDLIRKGLRSLIINWKNSGSGSSTKGGGNNSKNYNVNMPAAPNVVKDDRKYKKNDRNRLKR